jgi:hypothetical protein
MGNDKGKTIEQLKDKVHSGLDVLSDEELAILFEDAEAVALAPTEPVQPEPTPSTAPAPAEPAPPAGEPVKGQADLMNLVPDKFKEKDEAASLTKMIKALQEQETMLTQKSQEVSQLQNVVQELSRKPRDEYRPPQTKTQPAAQPTTPEPIVEVDDLGFLDAPVANTRAIATQVAKQVAEEIARRVSVEQLRDYDTFTLRRTTFDKFRADHSDFETIRAEFSEACKLHPEWDNDINGLPKLYDLAKTLVKARNVAPAVTPAQPSPVIDIEKLKAEIRAEVEASSYEKAKQAIKDEITRRRAAAGIVSTQSGVTPVDRVTPSSRTVALTPEEKTFQDMVDSGPQGLKELSPYGTPLSVERATTPR